MTCTGQTDLLDLITIVPATVYDEDQPPADLAAWAKGLGIKLRADSPTKSTSIYPGKGGPRIDGTARPIPDEPFHDQFSGYPIPPGSTQTVAEAEAWYLPRIESGEVEGMPISGDQTARWGRFQDERGWKCFPRYRDIWPILYGSEPPATRASEAHDGHCRADHPAGTR